MASGHGETRLCGEGYLSDAAACSSCVLPELPRLEQVGAASEGIGRETSPGFWICLAWLAQRAQMCGVKGFGRSGSMSRDNGNAV